MTKLSALALALILACAGCRRSPEYYLNKGNRLAAAGKIDEAALNYREAVQAGPRDGETQYQVGLALLRLRKPQEAYTALSRAADLLPAREDVQVKLADFVLASYMADRRRPQLLHDRVQTISDRLLAKNPNSFDGLRLQAHLTAAGGDLRRAEYLFRKANEVKPLQPEVMMGWTEVLLRDGQGQEGERIALQLIEKDKTFGPVYDLLFQYYMSVKRRADAENILKTKVGNNPTDAASALELAAFYGSASPGFPAREDDMKAVLQRILANPKALPVAHLQVGDLYAKLQRWDDALRQYQEGAQSDPKRKIAYQKKIADVWLTQGQGEKADSVVTEILKEQPDDEDTKAVKASLLLATGKPENVSQAVTTLQALVAKNPNNANWHFNLGRGLAAKGDINGARDQFEDAVKKNPSLLPPRIALIELAEHKGDFNSALKYADQTLALYPNLSRIKLVRAVSLMNTGNDTEARTELVNLEKAFPQDREVQLQLAVLDLHQKKLQAAEEHFKKLVDADDKNSIRAMSGLVETFAAENQFDKAIGAIQSELKKTPKSLPLRSMLARTAVLARKYDLAIDQYQQLLAADPKSAQLCTALGSVYRMKDDFPNAIIYLQKARTLAPNDPAPMIRLAGVLALSGQKTEALDIYRQALKVTPNDASTLNNTAYLMAETGGNLDDALTLAQKAVKIDANQPSYNDTLGWIYLKKNQTANAVQVFRSLTEFYPDNSTYHYHFGMALLKQGDKTTAKSELKTALSHKPAEEQRHNIETALSQIGS
jgi:tetratricopeptide (TPR) repeat protein